MSYYTTIIIISLVGLGVLSIQVRESGRVQQEDKKQFYLTYLLIALAAIAEWGGIQLNGLEGIPKWPLQLVKCADYILTPLAGGALIRQMKIRNIWKNAMNLLLLGNAIFQLVGCFNGWMIIIDEHNHYTRGPFYFLYIMVYAGVFVLLIGSFLYYGKSFHHQNRLSLFAIMFLVAGGITLQEAFGGEIRTVYISMTLGSALLFIHYAEYATMALDETLNEKLAQISTDALTGLRSRHAYSEALKLWNEVEELPEDFAVFSIDINGQKKVNDTLGHAVGDELICGAAHCIEEVFVEYGNCYRTGGDEFVVLGRMSREEADEAIRELGHKTRFWRGPNVKELQLSAGYALAEDHPGLSAEQLVIQADQAMYVVKREYYRKNSGGRRGRKNRGNA